MLLSNGDCPDSPLTKALFANESINNDNPYKT
jgi:hypothetical protein